MTTILGWKCSLGLHQNPVSWGDPHRLTQLLFLLPTLLSTALRMNSFSFPQLPNYHYEYFIPGSSTFVTLDYIFSFLHLAKYYQDFFHFETLKVLNLPPWLNRMSPIPYRLALYRVFQDFVPYISSISLLLPNAWRQHVPSPFMSPTNFWKNRGMITYICFPLLSSSLWEFYLLLTFPVNQKPSRQCNNI